MEKNLKYIIKQIVFHEKKIDSIDDLMNLTLNIVNDSDPIIDFINYFEPYTEKDKKKEKPPVYNDNCLNFTAVSGYIAGNAIINLICKFTVLTFISKVVNFIICIAFGLNFAFGIFFLIRIIVQYLKTTLKNYQKNINSDIKNQ